MSEFKKIYDRLKKRSDSVTDIETDFNDYVNQPDQFSVITEDTIHILNEYVKDPELTPVPKEVLNEICARVKFRKDNVVVIPMKDLYDLLREYEYPFYQEFKNSLGSFSGNLYIVMLFERSYDNYLEDAPYFNSTYLFLNNFIKDQNTAEIITKELLKPQLKCADTFCSKTDMSLNNNRFFQENGLIFISLKEEFLKDSLEHELTHFVQKTIGLNTLVTSVKSSLLDNFENNDKKSFFLLFEWIKKLTENDVNLTNYLLQFFSIKFKTSELHQSIKAVLNGFQRIYEYGKFSYIKELDFTKREIEKEKNSKDFSFRLNWLKKFITVINSAEFIENYLKPVIKNLPAEVDQDYLIKHRPYFIILLYHGFKYMFNKFDIDQKVTDHFNSFKFKDN